MKIQYVACAASSSVDHKTNELSLFHVLDEVGAAAFPLQLPSLCVATLFEREPAEAQVQSYVMTISLDDALLASFSMQVDFVGGRRNRSVNTIKGLAIPAPGRVAIRILQKADVLAEWSLVAYATATAPAPQRAAPRVSEPARAKPGPTVN